MLRLFILQPTAAPWPATLATLTKIKVVLEFAPYNESMNRANHTKSVIPLRPVASRGDNLSAAIAAEVPRLRRHAISLLYNHADAEDLVQDCVETALTKQETLQDPTRLRSWLFSILNNLFLMRLRSSRRRGTPLSIDDFADSLAASAAPEDRTVAMDLARAMGMLSPEHRQILLLMNLDGCSYQEIADILQLPIGTVMSRLARARQRLRALLEGHDLPAVEEVA